MATKEAEDMESLCLQQNRRFHILRFSPNDGISVLPFCLIFRGLYECVISSFATVAILHRLGVVFLNIFAGLSLQTQPNRLSILDYAQPKMYSENQQKKTLSSMSLSAFQLY